MIDKEARPARIVICEDESIVAYDIKTFLQKIGYQVPGVFAAAEDLLLAVDAVNPDLVLMDIHLQGKMDGIEAAAVLLKNWAVPVILLTANADGPTIERAKLTHPYAYILKPYDERELKTAISIGLYRASMERRLKVSEERYRSLFEEGLAATFLIDAAGKILESNQAFLRLSPSASSIEEFLEEEDDREAMMLAIQAGSPFGPLETRASGSRGQESWILFAAAPIKLMDSPSLYQCQAVDITERRNLMDQLIHAQKLSAMGRFAGGVAHDFNNVLTAVLGYARLLGSDLEDKGMGIDEIKGIEQAVQRAAALSRQLLIFSRREESAPGIFSLSDLVKDVERMLKRVIGEGATLVVRPSPEADCVLADRARLEQSLVNLVANARDAMPEGGRIVVSTGVLHSETEMEGALDPVPPGHWAFVEMQDEGTGIAPENMQRVFEPFFTTKPPEKGTGIGLSTVASIIRQSDGRIQLSSRLGAGTNIRLLFPLKTLDASGAEALAAQADNTRFGAISTSSGYTYRQAYKKGKTVIVVEDNDSVRSILEALLDRAGYRIFSASHPGEALLLSETMKTAPDALISEMIMPLMSGPKLAERLRLSIPGLPAVFLRGVESGMEAKNGTPVLKSGHDSFVDKPFSEEDLVAALEKLINPIV
jgi:PAS domain S-box-containing protein